MTTPIETELKLRIAQAAIGTLRAHPRVEAAALGPWRAARIDNRYVDTPDRALAAHRMALRLRRTSSGWVQTLKTAGDPGHAGGLSVRGEWEMPVAGPVLSLERLRDTPLAALGSPRSLAKRLRPIFTTSFRRETRRLALRHGAVVELAIDTGLVATGRGHAKRTASICEVELEVLTDVSGADIDADLAARELLRFATALAADVALLPLAESKAARGYRLLDDVPRSPAKVGIGATRVGVDAALHATDVLQACARATLDNLHALLDAMHRDVAVVTIDGDGDADAVAGRGLASLDPEFVHQARVGVRKLRSATRVFRDVLGKRRAARIDDAWRTVGRALGSVRDWDVLVESLPGIAERIADETREDDAAHDIDGGMRDRVDAQRVAAERALADALASPAPGLAALTLARELDAVRAKRSDKPLAVERLARDWLDRQQERVVDLARRIAVLDDEARHRLRIEVKRLRYGIDFFDGLFDAKAAATFVEVLGDLQDALGKLTDAVVQRDRVAMLVDAADAARATERYDAWLGHKLKKKLPKVASLAVALEMEGRPWA